jgi:hypothetical protein
VSDGKPRSDYEDVGTVRTGAGQRLLISTGGYDILSVRRVNEGIKVTSRSKYGQTPSKRGGRSSHLPEFELPRFESSRFDRLRRELTPPRFDLPKFENGFEPRARTHPAVTRSTRTGQTDFGRNWFSLLEREVNVTEVSLSTKTRVSSAESPSPSEETILTEKESRPLDKEGISLPEFDRPKFESSDYARLMVEANRPKFDRPRFDEPDEL